LPIRTAGFVELSRRPFILLLAAGFLRGWMARPVSMLDLTASDLFFLGLLWLLLNPLNDFTNIYKLLAASGCEGQDWGIPPERVVLAGFSMGGTVAAWTALQARFRSNIQYRLVTVG